MTFLLSSMVWIPALAAIGLLFFPARTNLHRERIRSFTMAATALAQCVSDGQLNPAYIIPSVFDPQVPTAVAAAVANAATPAERVIGDRGME